MSKDENTKQRVAIGQVWRLDDSDSFTWRIVGWHAQSGTPEGVATLSGPGPFRSVRYVPVDWLRATGVLVSE